MRVLLILSCVFILSTHAQEQVNPYKKNPPSMVPLCDSSNIELKNLPPTLDQSFYGVCYGHSSLLLLEYLRCHGSSDPKQCYSKRGSVLHLSKFDHDKNEIRIGGNTGNILVNFKAQNRKLATEECASYDKWLAMDQIEKEKRQKLKLERRRIRGNNSQEFEEDIFHFMSDSLQKDSSPKNKQCWADHLAKAGVNLNVSEILKVLNTTNLQNWKELRYSILVPEKCRKDMMEYPKYNHFSFYDHDKSFQSNRNIIYAALAAGYPVEAGFCASLDANKNCEFHSATIVGQRHVCNNSICRLEFKIQNSYGRSWQEYNNNGWVDAENISELMTDPGLGLNIILPEGKEFYVGSAPFHRSLPANGILNPKCGSEVANSGQTNSSPSPSPVPKPRGNVVCRG